MAGDDGLMDVKLSKKPEPLAENVETGISHLFDVLADKNAALDVTTITPMLDFVVNMQTDPKDIAPAKRYEGSGICLRQEVNTNLETILRYFYNPDIPNFLLCPAVLRLSGWHEGSELLTRGTPLWDELPTLTEPVMIRGKEFETNTPDSFAEAYYRYDLDRLIILLKHNGKNVAISISKQPEQSDVGKRGSILNDKEWEYFYSNIPGLNKGLLSWMDTFMYMSASVQIFVENDATAPKSSVFLFKWLNAGWQNMNVVERKHIYDGSLRYARSFTKVLESPALTPQELADGLKGVLAMNQDEIDAKIEEYSKNFEIRFKGSRKFKSKKSFRKVVNNGGYAKVLDADARKAILALEKMKSMLGMDTLVEIASPVAKAPVTEEPAKEVENTTEPES